MFAWAQSKFDQLSEAVAPPPDDGPGRFAYACQRGEEDNAMGCIAEFDPSLTVVNQSKGIYPLHLACQYSLIRLVKLLFTQPGIMPDQTDAAGNTPLHYAAMSTAPAGLECVQLLIQQYGANVCTKNYQGQTPYDVATMNSIRQYLLPIQLQAETQQALDNGGQGLPPGIDLGGLRIKNSHMPPPPTSFGGGPPVASAPAAASAGPPPVAGGQYGAGPAGAGGPPVGRYAPTPIPTSGPPGGGAVAAQPAATAPYRSGPAVAAIPPAAGHYGTGPPGGAVAAPPAAAGPYVAAAQVAATPAPPVAATPAPAPQSGTYGIPPAATPQHPSTAMFNTPTPSKKEVAPAPASMPADMNNGKGKHSYSRVGGSSAALSGVGKYRADGFHSSSSDVSLQKKYGHAAVQRYVAPPPTSGNSVPSAPSSGGVGAGGPNPFAGGAASLGSGARYGAPPSRSRYVNYGPTASAPAPGGGYAAAYQQPAAPAATYSMFVPGGTPAPAAQPYAAQQTQQQQHPYQASQAPAQQYPPAQAAPQQVTSAPAAAPSTPSTPYMPPPPYQSQNYSTPSGNQQPGFVSPAAATYGSPVTPGNLGTPATADVFQSPPPATPGTSSAPYQPAQNAAAPPAQTQQPTSVSASSVFGAPFQQNSGTANETFDQPAAAPNQAPRNQVQQTLQEPSSQQTPGLSSAMPFARTLSVQSAQSAEELFAEDAPADTQTTSEPVTSESSQQIFNNSAPLEPTDAADVFAAPPSGNLAPGDLTSAVAAAAVPPSGQDASEAAFQEKANGEGEEDDGDMVDISLTQSPAGAPRPTNDQVAATPAVPLNPAPVATPAAADNSLFAAIGMPPPPLSSRKK